MENNQTPFPYSINLHVNILTLVHIFVRMQYVVVLYDNLHMRQYIYVYKQGFYHMDVGKEIVLTHLVKK